MLCLIWGGRGSIYSFTQDEAVGRGVYLFDKELRRVQNHRVCVAPLQVNVMSHLGWRGAESVYSFTQAVGQRLALFSQELQ